MTIEYRIMYWKSLQNLRCLGWFKTERSAVKKTRLNSSKDNFVAKSFEFVCPKKAKLSILDHATHRLKKKHFSRGFKTNKGKNTSEVTCANIFCRKNKAEASVPFQNIFLQWPTFVMCQCCPCSLTNKVSTI